MMKPPAKARISKSAAAKAAAEAQALLVEAPDAPVQDAPVQDAPVQDAPVQDAPVQDAPVQDAPVQDAPVQVAQPAETSPLGQSAADEFRVGTSAAQHASTDVVAPPRDAVDEAREREARQSETPGDEVGEPAIEAASSSQGSGNGIGPQNRDNSQKENGVADQSGMNQSADSGSGGVPVAKPHNQAGPAANAPQGSGVPRGARPVEAREEQPERALESRGLRFRGREGRAEVRARGDERPFRPRGDMPRGDVPRGDGQQGNRPDRRSDGESNGVGRLAPRNAGNRDIVPRDGARDGARDNAPRDAGPREDGERYVARSRHDLDLTTLEDMNLPELREIARDLNIAASASMKKTDLVFRILEAQAETSGNQFKRGSLEILPDGKGFLRTEGYLPGDEDVYVSQSQIKRFNLRTGDLVSGQVRAPKDMERYFGLLRVEAINGEAPEVMRMRKEFEKLTPIFPDEKFRLETTQENITARIIDLVSPIGKGQRGLIVAPPKAGKTTLIKNVANSIALNHPEVVLIVLLIDERPEEVTDISRSVKGEVVASTFDELPENHMRVADMVLEKAKRLVEQKRDVVILLDSITRLSRASNLVVTPSGRTLSGGLDPAAMYRPKRMFGAARNIEEGGSLTILATALVDTGSRMDDMIFEEFKGTGNLDLVLDRSLFDQRIFPAIDINKTGTRRDDLLLSKEDLAAVYHLRRTLAALDNDKSVTLLIDRLKNTKTNADFMQIVQKSARAGGAQ